MITDVLGAVHLAQLSLIRQTFLPCAQELAAAHGAVTTVEGRLLDIADFEIATDAVFFARYAGAFLATIPTSPDI